MPLQQQRKRRPTDQKVELQDVVRNARRWHPHQLRHNAAMEIRKEFGLEAIRIFLCHHSTATNDIYAQNVEQHAIKAIQKVG